MNPVRTLFAILTLSVAAIGAAADEKASPKAAPHCTDCIAVTVDNFPRAETDLYFKTVAIERNGFGKFEHNRAAMPIDRQTVIRTNRDTCIQRRSLI